jgi:hypothetical protein
MATTKGTKGTNAATPPVEAAAPSNGATAEPEGPRRLTDTQLAEAMALIKDADSVELKVTVPTGAHRATIQGLPIDPVEAQPRQVFFFDTPDLTLNQAGLVVRARRRQGGSADTVIKLRPVVPAELDPELRKLAAFNVEVDVLPGGFVCSASLKGRSTGQAVRDVVAGKGTLKDLFSSRQRSFYKEHAPAGLKLGDLEPLGPTFLLKSVFQANTGLDPKGPTRQIVAELWLYPDGTRILELSTKCLPREAFQVAAETRAYLASRGIELGGAQQTKTKTALEFYAGQAKEAAASASVASE